MRGPGGELLSEWKDPGLASGSIRDFIYAGPRLVSAVDKMTTADPNAACGIIVIGTAVTVSAASGQNPCFTFHGTTGRLISVLATAVSPASFSASWSLTIRKPDGSLLGSSASNCCGATTIFADTRELPVDGSSMLTIDPSGTASGTVSIGLFDIVHVTGPITANGAAVGVPLTAPGQNGELTFVGTEGQIVSATMMAISPATFGGPWYLKILKPDGAPVTGGGGDGFGCCTQAVAFRDAVALPVTGMYKVVVDPAGTRLGTVEVRLYSFTHDTRPLVPGGDPITVSLTTPGRNALLTFNGIAGQTRLAPGMGRHRPLQEAGCDVLTSCNPRRTAVRSPARRPAWRARDSPERCHACVLPDVLVGGQDSEPVLPCERDDHAIERIPVEGRQGGGRTRHAGIEGDFPQIGRSTNPRNH